MPFCQLMIDKFHCNFYGLTKFFFIIVPDTPGVATFCRNEVTPIAAEEGLSAVLTSQPSIECYGNNTDFTLEDLEALDAEGRAMLTEHRLDDGKSVVIINVYCPRADKENKDRVDFKLKFYKLLQERAETLVKAGRYV